MAKFKISDSSLKKFSQSVVDALDKKVNSPATRGALSRKLRPFMSEQIEFAIAGEGLTGNTVTCNAFRPDRQGIDVVGALGIGVGGSSSPEKYTQGWRDLLPGQGRDTEGAPAATISLSFAKNTFGKITYNLDIDKFYDSKTNTYVAQTNGKRIQWMRQFIEGLEVLDYTYVEVEQGGISDNLREHIINDSRTGLGVMIPLNSKSINLDVATSFIWGPQPNPFPKIKDAIVRRLSTQKFKRAIQELLGEVLRNA